MLVPFVHNFFFFGSIDFNLQEGFALRSWEKAMAIENEKEIQNMIARRATRSVSLYTRFFGGLLG